MNAVKTLDRITVEGGEYTVARWANPGKPPLLLVHGITGTHMVWPLVVEALTREFDIYAPDLRGRGGSGALPGPFGLQRHVQDLLAVLDAYGLERVAYAGHSLGAYIGLEFAAMAPQRLTRIALVDGGVALPLPDGADPDAIIRALLGPAVQRLEMTFNSLADYEQFWRAHPAFSEVSDWQALMAAFVAYDLTGEAPALRSGVNPAAVLADGAGPVAPEMLTRIDEAPHPLLLLTAPRGLQNQPQPMMPLAAVSAKVAANDNLEFAEIPDCNHYTIVMGGGAATVAAHLERFLG